MFSYELKWIGWQHKMYEMVEQFSFPIENLKPKFKIKEKKSSKEVAKQKDPKCSKDHALVHVPKV